MSIFKNITSDRIYRRSVRTQIRIGNLIILPKKNTVIHPIFQFQQKKITDRSDGSQSCNV